MGFFKKLCKCPSTKDCIIRGLAWAMLVAISGVLIGAIILIVDSRKKHHEQEVMAINGFIREWEEN